MINERRNGRLGKLHKLTHVFTIMSQQRFWPTKSHFRPIHSQSLVIRQAAPRLQSRLNLINVSADNHFSSMFLQLALRDTDSKY